MLEPIIYHWGRSVPEWHILHHTVWAAFSLEVEIFQTSLEVSGQLCISSHGVVLLVLSKFLAGHVIGQFRVLIQVCLGGWKFLVLPLVLHAGRHSSLISHGKDHIRQFQ